MVMKLGTICMLVVISQMLVLASSVDPLTAGAAVIGVCSTAYYMGNMGYCYFYECCNNERWVKQHATNLTAELHAHVYGQHLALDAVPAAIRGHLAHPPKKALVLSFHGTSGTGKNLVAKIVAENRYSEGMKSKFVHILSGDDFQRNVSIEYYKDQLRGWIIGNVSACENQLFIFDEVEKMPPGLLDTLKRYVDHYESIEGVDYRKAIYIFLSNAGGNKIAKDTQRRYQAAERREDIKLTDLQHSVGTSAFHEKGFTLDNVQYGEFKLKSCSPDLKSMEPRFPAKIIVKITLARDIVRKCASIDI